jgi:hypothetical protein
MKKIDINWLKKFQSIVDKQNRSSVTYRQCSRCDKEVFVIRVFNKLIKNKTYKLKIKDKIYYGMFILASIKVNSKFAYKTCGVNFHLGYNNHEYSISFLDANNSKFIKLSKIHWNDIIKIQYEEIPVSKFYEICLLYIK